jgi:hypothetical protein
VTDHEKLLVAYFSEDTERQRGGVTMQEVTGMLNDLGANKRKRVNEPLARDSTAEVARRAPR